MSFTITSNTISPELARMARECRRPKPILKAMGTAAVSITQRSFNDAGLRITSWAAVKKAQGAILKRSGALWRSIRMTDLTDEHVIFGTDRPYAGFHQFGTKPYVIRPKSAKALFWPGAAHPVKSVNHPGLPPRPFFPFDSSGRMAPFAIKRIQQAAEVALRRLLRP